jgi:hypothetical protein
VTRLQRQKASRLVAKVVDLLQHPDMPVVGAEDHHDPARLTTFLAIDAELLSAPGKIQERKHVMGDLQLAADYLSHPAVARLHLAVPPSNYARALREIVRDLKPKSHPWTAWGA